MPRKAALAIPHSPSYTHKSQTHIPEVQVGALGICQQQLHAKVAHTARGFKEHVNIKIDSQKVQL